MAELRVLVCDDDPDMLELMLRRLDKMGLKPDRAGDGGVAQTLIMENHYDLIVTDIYMPEATGLELLQLAKQRDTHVQVVIVTASATLDNAIDALNHGAFGYLTKPFDHLSVFDSTISRALEFRQLIMANRRMAEAQKMRGDMLEDEVAKRVGQLREKQQGLIDLLNCLPDGIVVVEEGGKLMMTSPAAEQWLARDRRSNEHPIAEFLGQVHSQWAEHSAYAQLGEAKLQLLSVDYPHPNGTKRKAVIIRKADDERPARPGTLALESVAAIKDGLAWLFRQDLSGPMQERVKQLANHIGLLEQLTGGAAPSGATRGGTPPQLTPATLPEYLRHEPALDMPGASWEEATLDPAGPNGKPGSEPTIRKAPQPDTRPTRRVAGVEPPSAAGVAQPPGERPATRAATARAEQQPPEAEDAPTEAEGSTEEAPVEAVAERPAPAAGREPADAVPEGQAPAAEPEPIEDELAFQEEPIAVEGASARIEAGETLPAAEPEEAQLAPLELGAEPKYDPSTAPTQALDEGEAEQPAYEPMPVGTADDADLMEEPMQARPPEQAGRKPLWQRFAKNPASAPGPAAQPRASATAGRRAQAEPELQVDLGEQRLQQAPDWLPPEDEDGREAKPEPKPKQRQQAPAASAAAAAPKAQDAGERESAQKAEVRKPSLTAAAAEPRAGGAKKRRWPPQLPSQDPDFDPELDVSG